MNFQKITNVPTPILPNDPTNVEYVNQQISNLGITKITVTLTGTEWMQISTSNSGCFEIYITSIVAFGPSAIFAISKTNTTKYPQKNRFCSSPGNNGSQLTQLDLKWEPGEGMFLKKDTTDYDGDYVVNLQNLSGVYVPAPDFAELSNLEYITALLNNLGISTQSVILTGKNWTYISAIEKGSFTVNIQGTLAFSANAMFSICKNDDSKYPHKIRKVACRSSFPSDNSSGFIELDWQMGHGLRLRKDDLNYDGFYIVKIS